MEADGVILCKGEHILLEERASRQLFWCVYIRGRLILTDRRLIYLPRKQTRRVGLMLSSLTAPQGGFRLVEPPANLFQVTTIGGKTYRFLLRRGQRRRWQEALEWAMLLCRRRAARSRTG